MINSVTWSPGMRLDALEQECIIVAYRFYAGNKTATANSLGLSIRTLDSRLEKYEMDLIERELADAERKTARDNQLARARGLPTIGQLDTAGTIAQNSKRTDSGIRAESFANATAQPSVSLSKRKEV